MPLCFGTTEYNDINLICKRCRVNKLCKDVNPKIIRDRRQKKKKKNITGWWNNKR